MEIFELIITLQKIPNGSTVRRLTGEKEYTVKRNIKIYTDSQDFNNKEIKCDTDCVFLIPADGNICMFNNNKKVVWMVEKESLRAYLDNEEI